MPVASRVAAERGGGKGAEGKDKRHACMKSAVLERFTFEKGEMRGGGPRRPAQSERKNRVFSAKRQAVWCETQRVSNRNCSGMDGGGRDILREVALSRYRQGTGERCSLSSAAGCGPPLGLTGNRPRYGGATDRKTAGGDRLLPLCGDGGTPLERRAGCVRPSGAWPGERRRLCRRCLQRRPARKRGRSIWRHVRPPRLCYVP